MNESTRTLGLPGSTPARQGSLPRSTTSMPGLPGSERRIGLPGTQTAAGNASVQKKTSPGLPLPRSASHQNSGALPKARPENTGGLPTLARKTVTSGGLPRTKPALGLPSPASTKAPSVDTAVDSPQVKAPAEPLKAEAKQVEAKKKPAAKPAVKRRNRDFKLVERDYQILRGLIRYKILTPTHISRMVGASRESIRKRMDVLIKHGYAERGPHKAILVYFPTALTAQVFGMPDGVIGKKPTVFGYKHLLFGATFGIEMERGENVSTLTGGLFPDIPQNVVTEVEIRMAEKVFSPEDLWASWKPHCKALLQDQDVSGYPSLEYGLTNAELDAYCQQIGYDDAGREVFMDDVRRYITELSPHMKGFWLGRRITQDDEGQISLAYLFNTRDRDLSTTKTVNNKQVAKTTERTPDLVITLPNIIRENGTITGGCYAVENELHPKDMARCVIILLNLWHNPLLAGALFVTDNPQVVNIMKKAMTKLSSGPHSPFTMEQALDYFHFVPPMLLNASLDETGLLG